MLIECRADLEISSKRVWHALADNVKDSEINRTALAWASMYGFVICVNLLLEAKANVHARDANSQTPFGLALCYGRHYCLKSLLEAKSDIEWKEDESFLHLFAERYPYRSNYFKCFKFLLESKARIDLPDRNGNTPLSLAVMNRRDDYVHQLLGKNADVNYYSMINETPLLKAFNESSVWPYPSNCLELLLKANANVNAIDNGRNSPLSLALHKRLNGDRRTVVALLLSHKGNPNIYADYQTSFRSILYASLDICVPKVLINLIYDFCLDFGKSILMEAVGYGDSAIIQLLLDHRADISWADAKGETALSMALKRVESSAQASFGSRQQEDLAICALLSSV